ncbi:hypothetical protein GDO81_028560 [Engystomops pustulosus]|uniref:Taste receptor type 2 n=1 Tax=Engystomops pustulosus TaxID=76066 RepID=A0AAV6ZIX8_ENGPU|nr:hypothetical protein GDO81_028560 [Engystomops pustulosus]
MFSNTELLWNIGILAIDSISLLMTLPEYVFIQVVIILEWRKNKRFDISDQLISGLGLLSLIHKISQVNMRYTSVRDGLHSLIFFSSLSFNVTCNFINLCTLLFSTWLSIHFCLKIVNINHNLYIYIHRMFPKMFPWILFPSVLVSLLISGPYAYDFAQLYSNSTVFLLPSYFTNIFLSLKLYFAFYSFCFIGLCIPLLVTIVSLYRHIHQMQSHSLRSDSVKAHIHVVITLVSLLCLNFLHFLLPILIMFEGKEVHLMNINILLLEIWHFFDLPVLIRGNKKLQKKLYEMWLHFTSLVS